MILILIFTLSFINANYFNLLKTNVEDFKCTDGQYPCPCFIKDKLGCKEIPNPKHAMNFLKTGFGMGYDLSRINLQGKNSPTDPNPLDKVNLRNAKLKCANISGAIFDGADFTGADLTGAQLPLCILKNCNFQYAILDHVNFNQASILNCDLRCSSLKHTNFHLAEARGSDFSYSNMCDTNFERTNLAYTSHYKSKGTYKIGYAKHPGDQLYTNFCCSIDRCGKLNHKACIGGYSDTSEKVCIDTFKNSGFTSVEKIAMAPDIPNGGTPSSFIHDNKYEFRILKPEKKPDKPKDLAHQSILDSPCCSKK